MKVGFLNLLKYMRGDTVPGMSGSLNLASFFEQRLSKAGLFGVAIALIGLSSPAHAFLKCDTLDGNLLAVNAGSIVVPANTPSGKTVKTLSPTQSRVPCHYNQDDNHQNQTLKILFATTSALSPGYQDVYDTNIPGLGIRYAFDVPQCKPSKATFSNRQITLSCFSPGDVPVTFVISVTPSLVVTGGPVAPGSLSSTPKITTSFDGSDSPQEAPYIKANLFSGTASGTVSRPTCTVKTSQKSVVLPTVAGRLLGSVGDVAGRTSFDLEYTCQAGLDVYITLTDGVAPANRTDSLVLSPQSLAAGVGVQVLNSAGPISFGPDSSAAGTENQWHVGMSPDGMLRIPLSAQYIRTGPLVPGTVKALATFVTSYQ